MINKGGIMRNKIICDYCANLINDDYSEVPMIVLELPNDILLFCDEDCQRKYVNECTLEKYVDYEGNIK